MTTGMITNLVLSLSLSPVLISCTLPQEAEPAASSQTGGQDGAGDASGTGGSDREDESETSSVVIGAGSYFALESTLGITAGSLAPDPGYKILNQLHSDPGKALVTVASEAGVPAAETLFEILPESISSRLAEWFSEAINIGEVAVLIQWSQTVLAEVQLESTLEIGAFEGDVGTAVHRLHYVSREVDGVRRLPVPQLEALPGAGHSELEIWTSVEGENMQMILGEHRFGLLIGEAAYQAFEAAVAEKYGAPLRATLGEIVDCPAAADSVAEKCYWGVCVGHASELEALCDGALDAIAKEVHEQFRSFDTELLNLHSGEAKLRVVDGQTHLEDGIWQAEAELGVGLRDLPATFAGQSIAAAR